MYRERVQGSVPRIRYRYGDQWGGVQGSDLGKGIQRSGGEVPGRGIKGRGSRDQRVQGSDLEIKGRESRDQESYLARGPRIRSREMVQALDRDQI